MKNSLPDTATSFSELAAILEIDRGHLGQIRRRDSRFPRPDRRGQWPVVATGLLLEARRVMRMTDYDYDAERRSAAADLMRDIESGTLGKWPARAVRILRSIADGSDPEPNGTSARQEYLNDLSASMTQAGNTAGHPAKNRRPNNEITGRKTTERTRENG